MDSKTEPASEWNGSQIKGKPLNEKLDSISMKMKDISKAKRVIKDEKGLPIGFEPFNKTDMSNEKEPASESERINYKQLEGHTHGPWSIENIDGTYVVFDTNHFCVCEVAYQHDNVNAKLLAAAPNLLKDNNDFKEEITRLKAELERERENVLYEASEYFQEFGDRERFTSLQVQQVLMSLIKTNQKIDYGKDR